MAPSGCMKATRQQLQPLVESYSPVRHCYRLLQAPQSPQTDGQTGSQPASQKTGANKTNSSQSQLSPAFGGALEDIIR